MTVMHSGNLKDVNRKQWVLYVPFLLGVFLRFDGLAKQALFLDEAFSAHMALRSWALMLQQGAKDVHPLLYYAFLKPTIAVLPLTEWTLRLPSATFSVLALALAIRIARQLGGIRVGLWTGWLLSWSSLHLYYAQEARMYALLDLCWLLGPWLLLQALRSKDWRYWLGWAVITGAAIHTQFYGLLLWGVGALGSGYYILQDSSRRQRFYWIAAQLLVLVMTLPLAFLILRTVRGGVGGTWVPTWEDPLRVLLLLLFGFTPVRSHFLHGELLSCAPWSDFSFGTWSVLGLLFVLPAGLAFVRGTRLKSSKRVSWPLVFGGFPVLLAAILLHWVKLPFWSYRPLIGAGSWLLIALASGWSASGRKISRGIWVLLLLANLGSLWAYKFQWMKDYSRMAVREFQQSVPVETVLILDRFYNAYTWNFYHDAESTTIFGLAPASEGNFTLKRMQPDDGLLGKWEPASCADLPEGVVLGLYDPARRRLGEGAHWPVCLQEHGGWIFDAETCQWVHTVSLLP